MVDFLSAGQNSYNADKGPIMPANYITITGLDPLNKFIEIITTIHDNIIQADIR